MTADKTRTPLPTLWLLGKTGAGKSSLIRHLTGNKSITIGNGFRPCTTSSEAYNYPETLPWVRFLDTRGLDEAGYNPEEDLIYCQEQSHALLICARLDDPEQSSLITALKKIRKKIPAESVLVIHTASEHISNTDEKHRAYQYQQQQIEEAWGGSLTSILMDLSNLDMPVGAELLQQHLLELLPAAAHLSEKLRMREDEQLAFNQHKPLIKRFATAAAATDTIPVIGFITVPSIQAALLNKLAKAYELKWSRKDISAFVGTLGTGFGIQYASHLGLRQLVKLLPVYGQTLGSAGAAAVSFATTYAIGRVACLYLYYQRHQAPLSPEELQKQYRQAFTTIRLEKIDEQNH